MLRRFCAKGFFGISFFATLISGIHHSLAADEALPAELQKIVSLQRRTDILAAGELGPDNYHLAKSRIWLDLALSEYHESEKDGIVTVAIEQASTLLDVLEKKLDDISMDTPVHIPGSELVRPDLWKKITSLKNNEKTICGQRQIAEAEVYLVWAGHEKLEANWRNAKTYARSAAASISEARAEIEKCAASLQPKQASTATAKPASAMPAPATEKPRHIASDLLPAVKTAVPVVVAPIPVIAAPAPKADAPLPDVAAPAPVVEQPSLMSANQPATIAPVPEETFPAPAMAIPAPAIIAAPPANQAPPALLKNPPTVTRGSPHEIEQFMLSGTALFEFKKATLDPSAQKNLRQLLKSIKNISMLDKVELTGHTDRWRGDGRHELNQLLSEQRAASVKRYLVRNKVPAARIHASGVGSSQPLVECPADLSKEKQIACLQPNRRVEIILRGTRPGTTGRPENN